MPMKHCDRPWWKRPPVWFIAIAVVLLVATAIEHGDAQTQMAYSAFLDQVEAGNVASVTFQGTEITGRFKQPAAASPATGARPNETFRSRVPDVGDPGLIPVLRRQHAAIAVTSPTAWSTLLGHLPWPMLILVGAMLIVGLVRLVRGGQAPSGQAAPMVPMHGMMGFVAGLFAKRHPADDPATRDSDEPKNS
jgi:ATP-dependent Zn protease